MKIIIAEKPIAAQRIASILGKPKTSKKNGVEYYTLDGSMVVPLKGHVLNVDFSKEYKNWRTTDLDKLVDAQLNYEPIQKSIVKTLEDLAPQCEDLLIATDYDNEGESIGKEAVTIITDKNPAVKIKRAKFSALTNTDVLSAFRNLVEFDYNLADSADTRREVDLIWGAALTRYVSLAARRMGKEFLSVGRVQTPTLALVVNREKEIMAFKPKPFWMVFIECDKDGEKFTAFHEEDKIFDKEKAAKVASIKLKETKVKSVTKKELVMKPPAPFNTTEFLRSAANIGFIPQAALSVAESLYMSGYTSYPRTDNTVYPSSINLREILEKFSKSKEFGALAKKLLAKKQLKPTKGKKQTTDHPPIYPVDVIDKKKLSKTEWSIYELIVRRFFATLADDSTMDTVKVVLDYGGENFVAHGRTIKEAGWKEFYTYSKTDEVELPELKEKDKTGVDKIEMKEDQTKPKARYTPATLIKIMEDNGLGTKATRAEMLQKLLDRGYIQGRQNFTPSQVAFAVVDALDRYVPDITKPDMTAKLEEEMEQIAEGKQKKYEVVEESRELLHKVLAKLVEHKDKITEKLLAAMLIDVTLGKCPNCADGVLRIIRTRRGTRFAGCSNYPNCKTGFPLPAQGKIQNLNKSCEFCGLPTIRVIRFKRRPFDMCIKPDCESKKDWGKKKDEKKAAKVGKTA